MSGEAVLAFLVRLKNALVGLRRVAFHPREQRRTKVQSDAGIVIDDLPDVALFVGNAGRSVGRIAFRRDALIPVVVGIGGLLAFHGLKPRVYPRRLVEMSVNADTVFHQDSRRHYPRKTLSRT